MGMTLAEMAEALGRPGAEPAPVETGKKATEKKQARVRRDWAKFFQPGSFFNRFFSEKDIPDRVFTKTDRQGLEHTIPNGVVVEWISQQSRGEQAQAEKIIRQIDLRNGDINHFLEHMAGAVAESYGGALRFASVLASYPELELADLPSAKLAFHGPGSVRLASRLADLCSLDNKLCHGNLGLKRAEMPQLRGKALPKFLDSLRGEGVAVNQVAIPAGSLMATQVEMDSEKVQSMVANVEAGNQTLADLAGEVVVSDCNHILDGHHRWAAVVTLDPKFEMPSIRVGMNIENLLESARNFRWSTTEGMKAAYQIAVAKGLGVRPRLSWKVILASAKKLVGYVGTYSGGGIPGDEEAWEPGATPMRYTWHLAGEEALANLAEFGSRLAGEALDSGDSQVFTVSAETHPPRLVSDATASELAAQLQGEPVVIRQAASQHSGLYGYRKATQSACETSIRKLSKRASSLARNLWAAEGQDAVDFLSTHHKRTKSRTARVMLDAMKDLGPKVASEKKEAKAKAREHGMYGFSARTAEKCLHACSSLRQSSGSYASELHKRYADHHDRITGFLKAHCDGAKCGYAQMLLTSYPDATRKFASEKEAEEPSDTAPTGDLTPKSVAEWLKLTL